MNKTLTSKTTYDYENDILYVVPLKREYDTSCQVGNLIFDLDAEGRVSGVEIMGASKIFNVPKVFLKEHLSGRLHIMADKDVIRMVLSMKSMVRNAPSTASVHIERMKPEWIKDSELRIAIA